MASLRATRQSQGEEQTWNDRMGGHTASVIALAVLARAPFALLVAPDAPPM